MPIASISGLDHVVVVVRDLAAGARAWESLGFTVAPLGLHPPHMGTANHTIMFGEDYIELIAVVASTDHNVRTREFLARRGEGLERVAFTSTDAAAGVAALNARGITAVGPLEFSRPVDLPDGRKALASFRTFFLPHERPAGMGIFACQHLTRETVWIPHLTRHANTAGRIDRLEILSRDPPAAAAHMSRLIDRPIEPMSDGALGVRSGANRAGFVFLDRATLERRHPGTPLAGIPEEGCVTLSIVVGDLAKAKRAAGSGAAVTTPQTIKFAPADANGVMLELRQG
jgi:Glyoxalase-like domain